MKNKLRFLTSLALIALSSALFASIGQTLGLVENPQAVAFKFAAVLFAVPFVLGIAGVSLNKSTGLAFADGFVISDTTYAGEAASQFIVKAITGADMVQGGHIYVKDGIKKQFTIPRWDSNYEDLIQDRAATPTSKGSMTVDGKVLTPEDYMIYTEFNPRDFEDHWYAVQQNPTLLDRSLPASAESVVAQEILKRHTKYFNKMLITGDTSLAAPSIYRYFSGIVTKALADTATLHPAGGYAALTTSNIFDKLGAGYTVLPAALKFDRNVKIFMSYTTFDLYCEAQKLQTYKGVDVTQEGVRTFHGREVVPVADFTENCFLYAKGTSTMESNLWAGINSVQDANIQMSKLQANSEMWFFKLLMKGDTQIGWTEEVVLYHPSM